MLGCTSFLLTVARAETIRLLIPSQIAEQDLLGLGANQYHPFAPVVLCLVAFWSVNPYLAAAINVAGTKQAHFSRSRARETLKPHHIGDDGRQVQQSRINRGVAYLGSE